MGASGHDYRFSVRDHDSRFGGCDEVADSRTPSGAVMAAEEEDSRTPLSAILEGEVDERVTVSAMVDQAARRVARRVLEDVEIDEDVLVPILRSAIEEEILDTRLSTTRTMLRYFWQDARSPWDAMKTLLAATRLAASHLIQGASQTDVAFILQETKGATRAREKRKVEDLLRAWGVQGFHLEGGQKSESARAIYAEVQRGNRNRAKDKSKPRKRK